MYSVSKNKLLIHLYNALCHSVQGNFLSSISFIQGHRYETELEGKTDDVADGETDVLCVRLLLGQAMRSTWRNRTTEVKSSVCHLLGTAPLQANNALLILTAELS